MGDAGRELRRVLAARSGTEPQDWFVLFRARHGMLQVLRELAALRGTGSVLTQLLTCCTAVDPIIAAGHVPVYGDVSPDSYALDAATLPATRDLRALVMQHSFGLVDAPGARALRAEADRRGALLMEDCAHCVGRLATDGDGRPLADVSIHSFGVEKMLPTHFGGAVWVNPAMADTALRARLVVSLAALPDPDARLARAAARYRGQMRLLNHLPLPLSRALRALLAATGSFEPAIAPEELAGAVAHEPMAAGEAIAARALEALAGLDASCATRVAALAAYRELLPGTEGLRLSGRILESAQPLLRLPVGLPSDEAADEALGAIAALGMYATPWYRPPLFPGVSDPVPYRFDPTLPDLPHTAALTRGAIALPCDIDAGRVPAVVDAVRAAAGER